MKLESKFRVERVQEIRDTTYIWIDTYVDGSKEDGPSPRLYISGLTRDIGHLDPNINSFAEYCDILRAKQNTSK